MPSSAVRLPPPVTAPAGTARVWTLWSPDGPTDVAVTAPEEGTLQDVLGALASGLGLPSVQLWAGSAPLPADTELTAGALRHGAVLGLGRPGPRDPARSGSGALELHLAGGPDAGRTVPLAQGTLVLGRGAGSGLTIDDPDVSRRHAVVSVAEGRVTVADLASSNGTVLLRPDGPSEPVGAEPQEWPVGAVLRIGSTALRLTGPRGAPLEQVRAPAGRHLVRAVGSTPRPPRTAVVHFPGRPAEQARRRLGWVAVALPAVGGLLMAWLLATPHFLFFALLSPLVAVAGWASDRVTGRRGHRRALADHELAHAVASARLDAAVAADLTLRDQEHPDVACLAAAARRRSTPLWSRSTVDPAGLTVRLGTGRGDTDVTRAEADGSRSRAAAEHVPVVLALGGSGALGIVGPRTSALGVARAVVCQLAVLASPDQVDLVLICPRRRASEWDWLRWLPQLRAVQLSDEHPSGPVLDPVGAAARTVVVVDGPVEASLAEALLRADDRLVRVMVAESAAALALPASALLEVTGETGAAGRVHLPGAVDGDLVVLDAVSPSTAAGIARDLAGLTVPVASRALPHTARLLDLSGTGPPPEGGAADLGEWDRSRSALVAVLGTTGRERMTIDLVGDGPHALVAGTTGSGKSELLQTLVTSLALHHPPDRCSFLLVDYKGGAAFGEAAALPHTVGVLTDLDHQSTARALRSLSAELTRRERLLAEHRVRDLVHLPDAVPVGRLVIVVDEFATLAEELPGFVHGLVGIAQRGRSLGVHLVLATQRPAGVVSPEIRANSSLRICLRTTDEGDARDVLGSTVAAHLPPDRPGRAYLRTGSATPVLFQVARVSGSATSGGPVVAVRRRVWPPVPDGPEGPRATAVRTDLQLVVGALRDRAAELGTSPSDRPWLPPLPERLAAADLDRWRDESHPARLLIGLLDRPDEQSQTPLELDLSRGGGWLLVGGPRSGRTTALRTVLTEAVRRLPPDQLHVHVLDHGGGTLAREAGALPHCGTAVPHDDAHRSVRLLARLGAEVERRRGAGPTPDDPLLLVLVDGHESLTAQLEEADPATGGAGLLRLVREGAAVGVTVVLTAERAVPGSRVASAVGCRLVLPLPDRADYAVAGVPARAVPTHRPPGRALVGEDAVECQLAVPRDTVRPLVTPVTHPRRPPIRVVPLPADPECPLPAPSSATPLAGLRLSLGPGGDEGAVVDVDVQRTGGLLVVGPPGSGRSAALHAFARHCAHAGAAVVRLGDQAGRDTDETGTSPGGGRALDRRDVEALRTWAAEEHGGRPQVVVVDDLTSLPDATSDLLSSLMLPAGRVHVLASGAAAELAGVFRGPAVALRRSRTVLLLQPHPGDGELLGIRTPRTPVPARPGAGWLVTPGGATRVQVARRRTPASG